MPGRLLQQRPAPPKTKLPVFDARAHGADCDNCPLNGSIVVPPLRPAECELPDAILVGMEPGSEEVLKRTPFIGPSGRKINKTLVRNRLVRERMHITNATLCKPRKDEERPLAQKCCAPRLQQEIESYPKSVPVVTLGAEALKSTYGKKMPVGLARGFMWHSKDGSREIFPTIHPAYVLYDQTQAPLLARDFRRIAKRIHEGVLIPEGPKSFTVPRTVVELRNILANFEALVACDIETTVDPPTEAKLLCIGISDVHRTVVVPWNPLFRIVLNQFFARRTAIFHNGYAFDTIVLAKHGVQVPNIEDTLIAHHCYASHFPQRLDHLVSYYLDAEPWKIQFGKRSGDEKGLCKLISDEEKLYPYNAADTFLTARLWQEMQPDLSGYRELYAEDKDIADMCRDMQVTGAFVDKALKEELSVLIKAKEERLYEELKALNDGEDFAPTKTAHIRHILFEKFGAPVLERTMKGLPSTNKKVLQAFATNKDRPFGEFSKKLVTLRACSKMRVTYLDNLHIEADGRVHSSWRSFGTPTGRLASRKPNLMNLRRPENQEPEQRIREIYCAPPGHVLVGFDLSQVEPRVAAYIAGDTNMIAALESGDFHTANARILFGDLPELLDPKEAKHGKGKNMRTMAKTSGLAVNYLAGADKVFETIRAQGFNVKFTQVQAMLERLHRAYHQHFERVERDVEFVRKHGYLKIGFRSGRVRWLGHAPKPQDCANGPIQAGAADVMNAFLMRIWKRFKALFGRTVRLTAQIHDAAIFEVPAALVEQVETIIKEEAAKPVPINGYQVIFPIDLKHGQRWTEV